MALAANSWILLPAEAAWPRVPSFSARTMPSSVISGLMERLASPDSTPSWSSPSLSLFRILTAPSQVLTGKVKLMVIISETRTPRFRPPSTKQSPAVPGRQRPLLSVKNAHLSQPSGEPKIFSGVNPGWILLTAFRISPADAGSLAGGPAARISRQAR